MRPQFLHRHERISQLAVSLLLLSLTVARGAAANKASQVETAITIHGVVVDPNGAGCRAEVKIVSVFGDVVHSVESESDGTFKLQFSPSDIRAPLGRDWGDAAVVASRAGSAPAWIRLGEVRQSSEVKLQLVEDDTVLRAKFVDADGRPVPRAMVVVSSVEQPESGNLDGYLKKMRDDPLDYSNRIRMKYIHGLGIEIKVEVGERLDDHSSPETDTAMWFRADDNGTLILRGIGRERKVNLTVKAPNIASDSLHVVMRTSIDPKWKRTRIGEQSRFQIEAGSSLPVVYPCHFTHVASPSVPIIGHVTASDSGKPLANVGISAQMKGSNGFGYAETDETGRYEVLGLPTSGMISLYAVCPDGMPYLNATRSNMEFSSASPLNDTDFKLTKGIMIRGRLLDDQGKPAVGRVEYLALTANEFSKTLADSHGAYGDHITKDDGVYEVVGMPGLGILAAKTYDDRYLAATSDGLTVAMDRQGLVSTESMGYVPPHHYDIFQEITLDASENERHVDLTLRTGRAVAVRLVDSTGSPVPGCRARGINPAGYWEDLDSASFSVSGLSKGEQRSLMIRNEDRRLGAVLTTSDDAEQPFDIILRPYGTLTGRVVDAKGRPVAEARFVLMTQGAEKQIVNGRNLRDEDETAPRVFSIAEGVCDSDGRFRIPDAITGCNCELFIVHQTGGSMPKLAAKLSLRSGEDRDLGDLDVTN